MSGMGGVSAANSRKVRNMGVVCSFLVVAIHVEWPRECVTWFVNELVAQGVARIAVPFFFIVSGFFLASHFEDDHWYGREVGKRLRTLCLPFFLWSIVGVLMISGLSLASDIVSSRPLGSNLHLSNGGVCRAFGFDVSSVPMCGPLWFIRCLFFLVVLSPVLKVVVDRFGCWWLGISFVLLQVGSCVFVSPSVKGFLNYGLSLSGLFYFSLGLYISIFKKFGLSRFLAIFAGAYGVACLALNAYFHAKGQDGIGMIGCFTVPAMLYAVWYVMPSGQWKDWLTRSAFPVFVMHYIFLCYAHTFVKFVTTNRQLEAVLIFLVAISASIFVMSLCNRFVPKVARVLWGGR